MLDIVRKIARELSGPGVYPDVVVVNEVVIRSVLHALFHGKGLEYSLNVHRSSVVSDEVKYSFKVKEPGVAMSVQNMRESCAMVALERLMSDPEGREYFRRYIFSICAFMPENVDALMRTLGASSHSSYVKEAVRGVCEFLGKVVKLKAQGTPGYGKIDWQSSYNMCSDRLLKVAMDRTGTRELAGIAYAVYTSPACTGITQVRDELKHHILSDYVMDGDNALFAKNLMLLSNFNPQLSSHYTIRRSIDKRKTDATLVVRPKGVMCVLEDEGSWAHAVNGRVSGYIRNHASVNAEMLLVVCMLLGKPIDITTSNVGALLLDDGKVAYSFSQGFSFPQVDIKPFYKDLKGSVLSTEDSKQLVGLLLEDYHTRQRCSFNVCYKKLAQEIRRLSHEISADSDPLVCGIQNGLRARIARNIMVALCTSSNQQNSVIKQCSWDLASRITDRVKFLREFVDSEDYLPLVDFIKQSNIVDNQGDFARYLERRRKTDKLRVREEECKKARRLRLKFARALGEFVGFLSMTAGVSAICYAVYVGYQESERLLSGVVGVPVGTYDISVMGFVAFFLGLTIMAVSWISAKGAASAIRRMKEVIDVQHSKCVSFSDSAAEHFLPLSSESELDSVGYIGHFSIPEEVHCGPHKAVITKQKEVSPPCPVVARNANGVMFGSRGGGDSNHSRVDEVTPSKELADAARGPVFPELKFKTRCG